MFKITVIFVCTSSIRNIFISPSSLVTLHEISHPLRTHKAASAKVFSVREKGGETKFPKDSAVDFFFTEKVKMGIVLSYFCPVHVKRNKA